MSNLESVAESGKVDGDRVSLSHNEKRHQRQEGPSPKSPKYRTMGYLGFPCIRNRNDGLSRYLLVGYLDPHVLAAGA